MKTAKVMTESRSDRNSWLDVCRASAIILVVFGHGAGFVQHLFPDVVEAFKFSGFIGVELFFVLSGFLIGQMLLRYAESDSPDWLKTFYLRRMFRTLPNYALFLALNVLLALFAIRPIWSDRFWEYLLFVQNITSPHPNFFPEAWSLAIEELFYAGFPLCFLALSWLFGVSRRMAILVTALSVIGASILIRGLMAFDTASWDEGVRKIAIFRFDALMVGVLSGWLHQSQSRLSNQAVARALVVVLLFCTIYVSMTPLEAMNDSYFAKTFLFTFTSLGCAGLLMAGIDVRLPRAFGATVSLIARISYSAYLLNMPVMVLLNQFLRDGRSSGAGLLLLFLLLTFSLALIVYRNYEALFYRYRDSYVPDIRQTSTSDLRRAA